MAMTNHHPQLRLTRTDTAEQPPPDREQFLLLLEPVGKNLYNFIRKTMNFSHEAEDIYQDTLLRAFRYLRSYRKSESFRNWIFTIAHNLIRDYYSAATPRTPIEDAETLPCEHDFHTPQDAREIYAVAAKLKPKKREIFFLYYYNDFPIQEIVRITGVSRYNVKFVLHQCRKEIRRRLEAAQ